MDNELRKMSDSLNRTIDNFGVVDSIEKARISMKSDIDYIKSRSIHISSIYLNELLTAVDKRVQHGISKVHTDISERLVERIVNELIYVAEDAYDVGFRPWMWKTSIDPNMIKEFFKNHISVRYLLLYKLLDYQWCLERALGLVVTDAVEFEIKHILKELRIDDKENTK